MAVAFHEVGPRMPNIPSNYEVGGVLRVGHFQTIYPTLFRRVSVEYQRERLELADGDFLDLDWSGPEKGEVVVLVHGLEGNSNAIYMRGMVRALIREGFRCCAMNMRGCSGTPNRLLASYHSGKSEDLRTVVDSILAKGGVPRVRLVGFSIGGNIICKLLGEDPCWASSRIHRAVTFSVPCDLAGSAHELRAIENWLYMKRFLALLRKKLEQKRQTYPRAISLTGFDSIRSFEEFDDRYTAPLNGFGSAQEYWLKNSSAQFIPAIRIPTLLISSWNDSFLSPSCYPSVIASENASFEFEKTRWGGHCGFISRIGADTYYSEARACDWLASRSERASQSIETPRCASL